MSTAIGAARLPLDERDPLPPDHDRVATPRDPLGALYRAERPALLRFLARRTAEDRAEDIVQQVFARMAGKTDDQSVAIASPGAYLRQAARNLVRDDARAAERTSLHLHMPIEEVPVTDTDPIAALEARDRLVRIEAAVLRLKPLTRQIFLACRLDGYSYAEIAEQTGLSIRGVEKQMSRAIKQLGRHLRDHD
jgi:RNA polymerase sigma-70 factor (ECF subfamily)